MNHRQCERTIDRFLEGDAGGLLPLGVLLHLASCSRCRAEVRRLREGFGALAARIPERLDRNLTDRVMAAVTVRGLDRVPQERRFAPRSWIGVGVLILLGIVLVPYSATLIYLDRMLGRHLGVPLHLVLGLTATIYATIMIGSHMDDLTRWLRLHKWV